MTISDVILSDAESPGFLTDSASLPQSPEFEPQEWLILVVDDEADVHAITRLALRGLSYADAPIRLLHAHNAQEARRILQQSPDIALILLDVVMETPHAGLDLVAFIRHQLVNPFVRIVLRTGQPGEAPELTVIAKYQIDDYRLKTELTVDKLQALILAGLRTYEAMRRVENYRRHLEAKVVERTAQIQAQSLQLQAQNSALTELNQLKNKLFSILAHDLRSPLSTLQSLLSLATAQIVQPEDFFKMLGDIKGSLRTTFNLLNQLLTWARSQLEGYKPQLGVFDLQGLFDEVAGLLQGPAETKAIQLVIQPVPGILVLADRDLAAMVLRNLLQNAIKFTPRAGQVRVIANAREQEVLIEIQDTGIGLPPALQEQLNGYEIASRPGTAGESGSGLGLMFCRDFIKRNEGRFWFSSEENQGATFGFSLPLAPAADL